MTHLTRKSLIRIVQVFLSIFILIGSGWIFYRVNLSTLYVEYENLWYYRRMHPELQSHPTTIRMIDAGHDTTYADSIWINTIQYIADNVRDNSYTSFLLPLLENITELHPHFTRAYTLGLLLTPTLNEESISYLSGNVDIGKRALALGEKGMAETCDAKKLEIIKQVGITGEPWKKDITRNPCVDGFLPYYAAYVADGLKQRDKAYYYYTVASANSDAPEASRFLAILMRGKSGDRLDAAIQFLLVGSSGYDESPYTCQKKTLEVLKDIKHTSINSDFIKKLENIDENLPEYTDTKNPLISSTTNCHDSMRRAIKQIYLEYITRATEKYPEIRKGDDILTQKILPYIPTPVSNSGQTIIRKNDGSWEYRMRL